MIEKVGVCEHIGSILATIWSRIRHEIVGNFICEMCIPCDVHCNEIRGLKLPSYSQLNFLKNVSTNELKND